MQNTLKGLLVVLAVAFLCSCYTYQITDPETGKMYRANSMSFTELPSGAVQFYDMDTRQKVTLQSSEVQMIYNR